MDPHPETAQAGPEPTANDRLLFWACFLSIVATAFGFIIRTQIIKDWGTQFDLSETQKGEIFGVGLWPFAISIVLFSLIIDRIGYGKAMIFAFVCHVASAVITICTPILAKGDNQRAYWILYVGTFIVALGNGTVEAVANPVVATLFPREKTKWLNFLHAGWPGGLVLGGIIAILMGSVGWQYKVALLFIPVAGYAALMLGRRFPIHERVAAGITYKAMLQQVGVIGALIVSLMIVYEVTRVFEEMGLIFGKDASLLPGLGVEAKHAVKIGLSVLIAGAYGLYVRALGQPLFIFLLLVMVPLATTELGTDSWITPLMEPEMSKLGLQAGWVLVYTSLIMMILRFSAGSIVHRLSPLGLLAISALVAAIGLVFLSKSTGRTILAAATIYGFGKSFFWPTMLGVVAEQFPRGGALTLNTMGGVGMLAVGVIGAPLLGNIQDTRIDRELAADAPALHDRITAGEKTSVFGAYRPIDPAKVVTLPAEEREQVEGIQATAKKGALMTVATFPCIMLACYIALIVYFQARGGYKPQMLISDKEEELMMTGGTVGPSDM